MMYGLQKKRTGFISKGRMISSSGSNLYEDSSKRQQQQQELPNDLVDYYLKERFNIDLHMMAAQKNSLAQTAVHQMASETTT